MASSTGKLVLRDILTIDDRTFTCFSNLQSIEEGVHSIKVEQLSVGTIRASHLMYVIPLTAR